MEKYQYPPGNDFAADAGRAVTVGVVSTIVCAKNPQRGVLTICVDGATDVYMKRGPGAVLNSGMPLRATVGVFSCGRMVADDKYTGEIYAISSAPCVVTVSEVNVPD